MAFVFGTRSENGVCVWNAVAVRLTPLLLPPQRPTARELLKHKFIMKNAKKTSYLTELIDRLKRWRAEGHSDEDSSDDSDS